MWVQYKVTITFPTDFGLVGFAGNDNTPTTPTQRREPSLPATRRLKEVANGTTSLTHMERERRK